MSLDLPFLLLAAVEEGAGRGDNNGSGSVVIIVIIAVVVLALIVAGIMFMKRAKQAPSSDEHTPQDRGRVGRV